MNDQEILFIEKQIGYSFKNSDLLQQAFVRKSYSQENGGENNEVLEFIGDKVLDLCVVRYLTEKLGSVLDKEHEYQEYHCKYSEGKLTKLKARMVEKQSLARRIDELDFADLLIMGNGDQHNNVSQEASVKEDLFEAILGAVALDCNWNMDTMQSAVEIMLNPDSYLLSDDDNYVQLIQDWYEKEYREVPEFSYSEKNTFEFMNIPFSVSCSKRIYSSERNNFLTFNQYNFACMLSFGSQYPAFQAYGKSKSEARFLVCKMAYEWLSNNDCLYSILDEIENPNYDDAISQLEILARRGYFSIPTYVFKSEYDIIGNPDGWRAECHIAEKDRYFSAYDSSKKKAKKQAAYDMLMYVLGLSDEEEGYINV